MLSEPATVTRAGSGGYRTTNNLVGLWRFNPFTIIFIPEMITKYPGRRNVQDLLNGRK